MVETYYLAGRDYMFGTTRESYKLIGCEEDSEDHFIFYDYNHTELALSKNDFDTALEQGLLHKISASEWTRLKDLYCAVVTSLNIKPIHEADYTSDMARRILRDFDISTKLRQAYEAECKAVLYKRAMITSHFVESSQITKADEMRKLIDSALDEMLATNNSKQLAALVSAVSKGFTYYKNANLSRIENRGV